MIKFIDVNYHTHHDFKQPEQVLERHELVTHYARILRDKMHIQFVKHAAFEGFSIACGQVYHFFKGANNFGHLPFKANSFISKQKPDIVLVQGLDFPLQVLALRIKVGSKCKIIVQHHGELPFTGIKLWFQKLAATAINAYFFASEADAQVWKQNRVIRNRNKIYEVQRTSIHFKAQCKCESRKMLQIPAGHKVFLWIGNSTVNHAVTDILTAFARYLRKEPTARLYLICQKGDQVAGIKSLLAGDAHLQHAVHLVGSVPYENLAVWFSAADYHLCGSDQNGADNTLLEAMACGCIPVVAENPLIQKITGNGKYGHLYQAENSDGLYHTLVNLDAAVKPDPADVTAHFKNNLSYEFIAREIYKTCVSLLDDAPAR